MTPPSRFLTPLNEEDLFEWGAAPFRMDITTYQVLQPLISALRWICPPDLPEDLPGHTPANPIGLVPKEVQLKIAGTLQAMVNDTSLVPGIAQMGYFTIGGIEVQNGSYDPTWHHDGLAGKRHGHAGDFFLLAYFGLDHWCPSWGGQFEYAKRRLGDSWATDGFEPSSAIRQVFPVDRTVVLGWNQNPRLVHRAAPLLARRDRITLIASLDFHAR